MDLRAHLCERCLDLPRADLIVGTAHVFALLRAHGLYDELGAGDGRPHRRHGCADAEDHHEDEQK